MLEMVQAALVQDWDEHAIAMLDRCPSDKCFLSHYPPAHNDTSEGMVPVLCRSHFDEGSQMPSFEAQSFDLQARAPLLDAIRPLLHAEHPCMAQISRDQVTDNVDACSIAMQLM
jgi:hypothetical protein